MMSNNPTEVLKSMPANSIKHIEVITNPGPKYDAEGVGGILNIVTVGSGLEGYTATFSGNVSNMGAGGGLFGTVKSGKLTVSARYNYNYNDRPRSYSGGNRRTVGDVTEGSSDLDYDGSSKGHGNFQSGSMEASYEIDTLRLVSMSFGLWGGGNNSTSINNTLATAPGTSNELYRYVSDGRSKSSWYSIDGGVDYQRMFHVKDRMFTLSYKINTSPQTSDSYSTYNDMHAATDWEDFLKRLYDLNNDGSQNTTEHTFQADYTTPIGKIHTLEAGAKYILRDNSSEDDRYERQIGTTGDYVLDEEHSSHYKHQNDILAAYMGYGLRVKKISGRLGVRYEHTKQEVKYLLGRGDDFNKNFDDVVPSASIGYKLTDMSNLRFGYNMRIYRPGIWYLNPYLNDSNPTNISQGNSHLDSEKSHSFNLSYSNFTQKFNINLSARYSFTNNSIEQVTEQVKDTEIEGLQNPTGKEVLYSTYQNIGKSRNASLSGYVNWNATSNTRIYANLYGNYTYMEGANGLKNDGWNLFAYGGAQQSLPHDWRISLNIYGQTPWIMLQGKGSSFFDYGLSVNKSFLNKRLTLSAFASNFFKKYTSPTSSIEGVGFTQDSWNRYTRQRFGVSVSYRIGELKASVKKAARTISNDDVKGGGGEGGGGGE
nr:outer membrane beta-barrel family protein [Bacteroides intestinalis]